MGSSLYEVAHHVASLAGVVSTTLEQIKAGLVVVDDALIEVDQKVQALKATNLDLIQTQLLTEIEKILKSVRPEGGLKLPKLDQA